MWIDLSFILFFVVGCSYLLWCWSHSPSPRYNNALWRPLKESLYMGPVDSSDKALAAPVWTLSPRLQVDALTSTVTSDSSSHRIRFVSPCLDDSAMDLGENGRMALIAYYASLICLPLVLATSLLATNVPMRRHTYTSMIVCWILFSTSSLLL